MGLRTFTFGGKASSAYSMFITEAATYNVPERAVEMLEIPGRNGHYALDQGRFENVEVTYHVVVHKDTNANFQTELSDVRNWLASKVGYQRLTDDYNSNVYRMAIFKGGLETSQTFVNGAEFDIVFECKPQRWLTSGETATAVANNGTLTNPTLFEASPLLQIWGYGKFNINGEEMEIVSGPIGWITVSNAYINQSTTGSTTFDTTYANVGDGIKQEYDGVNNFFGSINYGTDSVASVSYSNSTYGFIGRATLSNGSIYYRIPWMDSWMSTPLSYGTATTYSNTMTITITLSNSTTKTATVAMSIAYDGDDTFTLTQTVTLPTGYSAFDQGVRLLMLQLNSSKSALGSPIYFDLDVGEAYKIENDVPVSVNSAVTIPSDLPKLPPGTNTFTYDNTITQFKVTPRWWKV